MLADRTLTADLQRFPAARVRAEIHEKVGQFLGAEAVQRHGFEHLAAVRPAGDGLQGLVLNCLYPFFPISETSWQNTSPIFLHLITGTVTQASHTQRDDHGVPEFLFFVPFMTQFGCEAFQHFSRQRVRILQHTVSGCLLSQMMLQ